MKRLFAITVVMLLSSAMFFVVVCAGADPVVKPLKGRWSGTTAIVGFCSDQSPFLALSTAKGIMTLTGESEWASSVCCGPTGHCEGTALITAANGDVLILSIIHDFNPVLGTWEQSEVFTGGTGRFEGVTGNSTSSGTFTFTGQLTDSWTGTNEGMLTFY